MMKMSPVRLRSCFVLMATLSAAAASATTYEVRSVPDPGALSFDRLAEYVRTMA